MFYPPIADGKHEYKTHMFASGHYSVAHWLLHTLRTVSANTWMHFERNFLHGHVQLCCLTQWISTQPAHPKITPRWDGTGRSGEVTGRTERGSDGTGQERDSPSMVLIPGACADKWDP